MGRPLRVQQESAIYPVTVYSDSGLSAGQTRHYRVRAYNDNGDSEYCASDSATTLTSHTPVDPPKDHVAVAFASRNAHAMPGTYFRYVYDGIGNRTSLDRHSGAGAGELTPANTLNQMTSRSDPGVIHVCGYAPAAHRVTVNGLPAHRDGPFYYAAISVDNSTGPVAQSVTVNEYAPYDPTPVKTRTFTRLVPAATDDRSYDDRGNLLSDSIYDYEWDALDRLTSVETNDEIPEAYRVKLEFEYDAGRRRTKKTVYVCPDDDWAVDSVVKFVYDGWLLIAELNAADGLLRSYVWGLDVSGGFDAAGGVGGLLAVRLHNPDTGAITDTYYVTRDDNGNVTALIDASDDTVAASYEYSLYGRLLTIDGNVGLTPANPTEINPFLFSAKYYDAEIGLYYYGYRYYDPATGRWLNRDPLAEEGSLNLYAFCGNDPVNCLDPLGLFDLYYHEQLTRKAFEGLGLSEDVLLAIVVYNLESDILNEFYKRTKAATVVERTLVNAREGFEKLMGRESFLVADGTLRELLTSYYADLHMVNEPTSEEAATAMWGKVTQVFDQVRPEPGHIGLLGNVLHATQDFFAHSNWAEIHTKHNEKADPAKVPTWYGVVGKDPRRKDLPIQGGDSQKAAKLKGLRLAWDGKPDEKDQKDHPDWKKYTHAKMHKGNEQRPFFKHAYSAAERTGREIAQELVKQMKKSYPKGWETFTKPLDPKERAILKAKYERYKQWAKTAGHWRKEKKKK